ncbi:hypothetical protein Taro_017423 [Colocasia esculenta]|uniref:Uncharacterized protein n=1 Tax=Colocasia esculenta TaxID=4460 RepID=A0A843UNJ2_COLES|nr:hypothetical protein [Colocasia esculenta]
MSVTCGNLQSSNQTPGLSSALKFTLSNLFQHGRGDECDLWKLTEFKLDSRFELGTQIHIK